MPSTLSVNLNPTCTRAVDDVDFERGDGISACTLRTDVDTR